MNRYPVSIITVTYNSEKTLKKFLTSVLKNMSQYDELILVDNNSRDNTPKILKNINLNNIKIVLNSKNLGYAKGINIGIEHSKNPFLIFLNPDIEVTKGWLETLIPHLLDYTVGAVGPLSTYTIPTQYIGNYLKEDIKDLLFDDIAEKLRKLNKGKSLDTNLLIGFCIATRRDVLDKIGYLDENLFLGNDDLELSWRLRNNGYKLKIALDTFVYHEGHVSFKTEKKSKTDKLVQESTNIFADKLIKHYGFGNVPHPSELWGISWFTPVGKKYKYMFKINGISPKGKEHTWEKKVVPLIVNYKNTSDTKECIESLLNQSHEKITVVVVDNSEDDKYWNELKESLKIYNPVVIKEGETASFSYEKDILLIRANKNRGFSAGNNIGIKLAMENNSDFIWILNPDTTVEKDTLKEMLEVSYKYDVLVITCKIKDYKEKEKVQYDGNNVSLNGKEDKPDIIRPPSFLSGANILLNKDVFEKIGLLDEDFFLYFEDNELFHRIYKNKISILYTPYTYIYHKGGTSIKGFLNNPVSMYYFTRNHLLLFKKTKEGNFSNAFKSIKNNYYSNYKDKKLLKAIILGIFDFIKGKTGKKDNILELIESRNKVNLKNINAVELDTEDLFKVAFSSPRKKEYFLELVKRAEEILKTSLNREFNYKC